eukprot:351651-Chlamydomonas_euryale.AAC.4
MCKPLATESPFLCNLKARARVSRQAVPPARGVSNGRRSGYMLETFVQQRWSTRHERAVHRSGCNTESSIGRVAVNRLLKGSEDLWMRIRCQQCKGWWLLSSSCSLLKRGGVMSGSGMLWWRTGRSS